MYLKTLGTAAVLVTMLIGLRPGYASDWPNWRGADRTGIVDGAQFDPQIAQDGSNVVWQTDVGVGYATVSVADGRAYTAGWRDGQDTFYCFDSATGDVLWSHTYASQKFDQMNVGGPSSTAAIDGDRVYHLSRDGRLFCFDAATGDLHWELNLAQSYGAKTPRWGFAGSPVIIGDSLFVDMGRMIAINKTSGQELWLSEDNGSAYTTPMPFSHDGRELLAAFPSSGLVIYDQANGETVAKHRWETQYGIHAATPIVTDDGRIFISSGYNSGGAVLQFTGDRLDVIWESKVMRNQMPTCVLIDGYLYGFDDTRLKCVAFDTGEEKWNERGLGQGTLIAAGDTLIVLSEKGKLITAKASPEGFEPIAEENVINEDKLWVSPTLADGRLYCRGSRGALVCVNVAGP